MGVSIKKIGAILLTVIFMLSLIPVCAVAAVGDNMISNGGFEINMTVDSTYFSFTTADKHSGSRSLLVKTTTQASPRINYTASIVEGAKYKFSVWIKGSIASGNGFGIGVYAYNGNTQVTSLHGKQQVPTSTWTEYTHTFTGPETADTLKFYIEVSGAGAEVYVDDLSLVMTQEPTKYVLDTNQVFYYSDWEMGRADVTVDDYFFGQETSSTVTFELTDGTNVLASQSGVAFSGGTASYRFDLSHLAVKKKKYFINATVYKNGAVDYELSQDIYKFDRPKALNENGEYIVDGEVFFPVYAHGLELDKLADAAEVGINVISYSINADMEKTLEELDLIHSYGLKAAVVCFWGMNIAGSDANYDRVSAAVRQIKDHPAVFSYLLADEPYAHYPETASEELKQGYIMIRNIDDVHPVQYVESVPSKYGIGSKYADIFEIDPYPGSGYDFGSYVGDKNLEACQAVEYKKPVINTLQAVTYGLRPTGTELRSMIYQALLGGAQGIGYYSLATSYGTGGVDGYLGDHPDLWPAMVSFAEKDLPIVKKHFSDAGSSVYNEVKSGNVWYESWVDGNNLYVAAQNRLNSTTSATISLTCTNGSTTISNYDISVVNGGNISSVTKGTGSFTVSLTARQAVLYKVTPTDSAVLGNILKNPSFETLSGSAPANWVLRNEGSALTAPTIATSGASDGNNYITSTGWGAIVHQIYTADINSEYVVEFDYKASTDQTIWFYMESAVSGGAVALVDELLPAAADWTRYKKIVRYDGADFTTGETMIRFRNRNGASDVMCLDNFKISKVNNDIDNLFKNPGFETVSDSTPANWVFRTWGEAGAIPTVATGGATNGSNYVTSVGYGGLVHQIVYADTNNDSYLLEFDYKSSSDEAIWLYVGGATRGAEAPIVDKRLPIATNWTRYYQVVNYGASDFTGETIVRFANLKGASDVMCLDNFKMTKIENFEDDNIIYDGNFELPAGTKWTFNNASGANGYGTSSAPGGSISQNFTVTSGTYVLSFDYKAADGAMGLSIKDGDSVITDVTLPESTNFKTYKQLVSFDGTNGTISFNNKASSAICVDNVYLEEYTSDNIEIIKDGEFKYTNKNSGDVWSYVNPENIQVMEDDGRYVSVGSGSSVKQTVSLDGTGTYVLQFSYKGSDLEATVKCGGTAVATKSMPQSDAWTKGQVIIKNQSGTAEIIFANKGAGTVCLDNVVLAKDTLYASDNLLVDGGFEFGSDNTAWNLYKTDGSLTAVPQILADRPKAGVYSASASYGGVIEQDIDVSDVGIGSFNLSFDYKATAFRSDPNILKVQISHVIGTTTKAVEIKTYGAATSWTSATISASITETDASKIRIQFINTSQIDGIFIDNVKLTKTADSDGNKVIDGSFEEAGKNSTEDLVFNDAYLNSVNKWNKVSYVVTGNTQTHSVSPTDGEKMWYVPEVSGGALSFGFEKDTTLSFDFYRTSASPFGIWIELVSETGSDGDAGYDGANGSRSDTAIYHTDYHASDAPVPGKWVTMTFDLSEVLEGRTPDLTDTAYKANLIFITGHTKLYIDDIIVTSEELNEEPEDNVNNKIVDGSFEIKTAGTDTDVLITEGHVDGELGWGSLASYIVKGGTETHTPVATDGEKMWHVPTTSAGVIKFDFDTNTTISFDLYTTSAEPFGVWIELINPNGTGDGYNGNRGQDASTAIYHRNTAVNKPTTGQWTRMTFDLSELLKDRTFFTTATRARLVFFTGWTNLYIDDITVINNSTYLDIVNANGQTLTSLPETASEITARASYFGDADKVRFILAYYETGESGIQKLVEYKEVGINKKHEAKIKLSGISKGDGKVVKAFLWHTNNEPIKLIAIN